MRVLNGSPMTCAIVALAIASALAAPAHAAAASAVPTPAAPTPAAPTPAAPTSAAPTSAAAPAAARKARPAASAKAPGTASASAPKAGAGETKPGAAPKSESSGDMTLKGGDEGTVFRSLTVEGEDRIHIEVERPVLKLDMDPERAPGLDRAGVQDVLDRTQPDLVSPLLTSTARDASPWVARPWHSYFQEDAVARFAPAVQGVERWRLVVVNARAESVAVFQGKGDPPRELAWDGLSSNGRPVQPGASYSYVFEARDKAGNRRNFVGEGFRVSAFRHDGPSGPVLVFSGQELARPAGSLDETPPILLEAASAMNQLAVSRTVRVEVAARSQDEAQALAQRIVRWMTPWTLGDPSRLQGVATVLSDAPAGGAVTIAAAE
jgi:hypothetical protein